MLAMHKQVVVRDGTIMFVYWRNGSAAKITSVLSRITASDLVEVVFISTFTLHFQLLTV